MDVLQEKLYEQQASSLEELETAAGEIFTGFLSHHKTAILLLDAPMGTGKTTFVSALGRVLGIHETINSPTFNLLNQYESRSYLLNHFDLYRLSSAHEVEEMGLSTWWTENHPEKKNTIHAIEWWERAKDLLKTRIPTYLLKMETDIDIEDGPRTLELYR